MLLALALALLPLIPQGSLSTTVIGDATGLGSVSETDNMGQGRSYWIEPQTRSFLRIDASEQGRRVVAGGTTGPWFKVIARMVFSPDGTRHAYVGRSVEGESVVVDGELALRLERGGPRLVQLPPLDRFFSSEPAGSSGGQLLFSPDSQHVAYVLATRAAEGPAYEIFLDNVLVGAVERMGFVAFTPASELIWSTSSDLGPGQLTLAGSAGPEFATIDRLIFGTGSRTCAYRGVPADGSPAEILIDNQPVVQLGQPPYADRTVPANGVVLSPDLSSVAVLLESTDPQGGAHDLFLNGEHVGRALPGAPIAFTPDGRLFHQRPDGHVVLAEEVGPQLAKIQEVVFSPTGDRALYVLSTETGLLVETGGERPHGPFTGVTHVRFSADGAHSTFITGAPGAPQTLHVDGQPVLPDAARILTAAFSEQGARLFVTASVTEESAWTTAAERARSSGVELLGIDTARRTREAVSPDGETRASFERVALSDTQMTFELRINDESTGERFDQYPTSFRFDDDGVLRFISRRGTDVLRAEYRPWSSGRGGR